MSEKTKTMEVLSSKVQVPGWLLFLLLPGLGLGGGFGILGAASGNAPAEPSPVYATAEDIDELEESVSDLEGEVRRVRENMILICAALEVPCARD